MKTVSKISKNKYHEHERIDNENTTAANTIRDNLDTTHTTQIHTNKYIERDPSKPTTASIRKKWIDKYANAQTTSGRNRLLVKARIRSFCFMNIR